MTVIIQDGFGGLTSGQDIGGTTPDTTNTPGFTWGEGSANSWEGDGSGALRANANNDSALIRSNISDDIFLLSVDFNANGVDNRFSLCALSDGVFGGLNISSYYRLNVRDTESYLIQRISNASTTLAFTSTSRSQSTTYTYSIGYDGTDLKCFRDGVEITGLTQSSYTINASLTGNLYHGFIHNQYVSSGGTIDNFILDNAPSFGGGGGTSVPVFYHHYRTIKAA